MSSIFKKIILFSIAVIAVLGIFLYYSHRSDLSLPKIAIAYSGPHSSLEEIVRGTKEELHSLGLKENKDISFEIMHVNFDYPLILQMLSKLTSNNPKILIAITTPVAQAAKGTIKNIPIVFGGVTDPVEAGLLNQHDQPTQNITGTSDAQDLKILLSFVKQLLPHAKKIGILYATGEASDAALVKMMENAARLHNMEVIAVPIEHARDVPLRMQTFKDQVDAIYVGASGPIQPSLPSIVAAADQMRIPVFNLNEEEVKNHQAFASFGVSYYQVGVNTAHIINQLLKGKSSQNIPPIYPKSADHKGFISKKRAQKLGITLPSTLPNVTIVE